MNLKIFVVYDQKAKAYMRPFYYPQTGMATRAVADEINDPKTPLGKHPEDYTLFQIGEFDESSAQMHLMDAPELVATGLVLLAEPDI